MSWKITTSIPGLPSEHSSSQKIGLVWCVHQWSRCAFDHRGKKRDLQTKGHSMSDDRKASDSLDPTVKGGDSGGPRKREKKE